jgi:hypothetical protein
VLLRAADPGVYILADDLPVSTLTKDVHFIELHLGILAVVSADSSVDCRALHLLPSLLVSLGGRPPNLAHWESSAFECRRARASPPIRAQARRCSAVVFRARDLPPSLPKATAWGFFIATILLCAKHVCQAVSPKSS